MRVLVVDDERGLVRALHRGLTAEGFAVDVALRRRARARAGRREDAYDVIVLDVMLPRRNGYDVVTELRARDVWTPVLMLSAKDGEYDVADGLDVGADDYLTKPFAFVVLVSPAARAAAPAGPGAPAGADGRGPRRSTRRRGA